MTRILALVPGLVVLIAGCGGGGSSGVRPDSAGGQVSEPVVSAPVAQRLNRLDPPTFTKHHAIDRDIAVLGRADTLMMSDDRFFVVVDDEVYSERYRAGCVDTVCFHVSDEHGQLPTTNLVPFVRQRNLDRGSGSFTPVGERGNLWLATYEGEGSGYSGRFEANSYGGWLDHSTFAMVGVDVIGGEFDGWARFFSYSIGDATGSHPVSAATWTGVVVATDTCTYCQTFGHVVQGDARIEFNFAPVIQLGGDTVEPAVDVAFTNMYDLDAGTRRNDIHWYRLQVLDGAFWDPVQGAGHYIHGRFYGPAHEEAGGVFERSNLHGAFGASRQ